VSEQEQQKQQHRVRERLERELGVGCPRAAEPQSRASPRLARTHTQNDPRPTRVLRPHSAPQPPITFCFPAANNQSRAKTNPPFTSRREEARRAQKRPRPDLLSEATAREKQPAPRSRAAPSASLSAPGPAGRGQAPRDGGRGGGGGRSRSRSRRGIISPCFFPPACPPPLALPHVRARRPWALRVPRDADGARREASAVRRVAERCVNNAEPPFPPAFSRSLTPTTTTTTTPLPSPTDGPLSAEPPASPSQLRLLCSGKLLDDALPLRGER
jgi:hypothetical protein